MKYDNSYLKNINKGKIGDFYKNFKQSCKCLIPNTYIILLTYFHERKKIFY